MNGLKKDDDYAINVLPVLPTRSQVSLVDEKRDSKSDVYEKEPYEQDSYPVPAYELDEHNDAVKQDIGITADQLADATEWAKALSLEETFKIMKSVVKIHGMDPNFPLAVITNARQFIAREEEILANPEGSVQLIDEMKIEAALISNNSPYAEVRAVVDNTDDPTIPSSTIRSWVIGMLFCVAGAFVNQLFSIRQPAITIGSMVAQLLAFPLGRACQVALPDWGFTMFGVRHSLNPGPFSRKEHMLITIMANVAFSTPYTDNIIWVQVLPQFFNQKYAGQFSYQILIGLATNFIGYGMAGMTRRFLVYPTYAVWPTSLVTIALNRALNSTGIADAPVKGPFGKIFSISRMRLFCYAFAAMFFYFWFPNYIFTALSAFNWLTWISPNNATLATITGFNYGLGFNPFPTFDWNIVTFNGDPLVLPWFNIWNGFVGMFAGGMIILIFWYNNVFNTGFLPINSNRTFDRFGKRYNVSLAIDDNALFDAEKYSQYSPAYMAAGNIVVYMFFFAVYAATVSHAILYHRSEIKMGFKNLWGSLRRKTRKAQDEEYKDVHNRLMAAYPEVSEWWYLAVLLFAVACGLAGIAGWETYTTPGVVFYGIALCALFVVPIGIITAITGAQVTLNVLAEFIGGAWFPGNALSMNFFKSFGYVTCAHAIAFSNDLKLAHYVKLPPRHAFTGQLVATLISTFVCTGVLNFQINSIPDVCTTTQASKFTCPGINTFFTASVFWGTLGPKKIFGVGGVYAHLLWAFPAGFVLPIITFFLVKRFPKKSWIRQIHPVLLMYGPLMWAPYNMSYVWPGVPVSYLTMMVLKKRYLAFWSKYNYIVSAAFSTAIALSGIIIFFALQFNGTISLDWWGNAADSGCDATGTCIRLKVPADPGYFGPGPGQFQ